MARRGLGKGLGAIFGEEIVEEVAIEHKRGEKTAKKQEEKPLIEKKQDKKAVNTTRKTEENKEKDDPHKEKLEQQKETVIVEVEKEVPTEIVLKLSQIEPNRNQPRKEFKEEQLQELAESIRQYGVLQPLLVQKKDDYYELIAGERRWRAAKLAGLKEVPVVIREYTAQQSMEISLIENIQRENLNPIEEALAYQCLMEEFDLKQEEIAMRVSKNRTTITNSMRLLHLTEDVKQMLIENRITSGHARALLGVENPKQQILLAQKIETERLSVREIEKIVKSLGKEPKKREKKQEDEALELIFRELEDRMKSVMGTKVNISRKDKTKGRIEIEYYSEAELERIVELIETIR